MRLRILDWNTRWFWITAFWYGKRYGASMFEFSLHEPQKWSRWIHVWLREPIPDQRGGYEIVTEAA